MLSDQTAMPNMESMRLPFIWSEWIGIYFPCGQSVSSYIAHVVRVSTWSECITMYCPHGQSVSPHIALTRYDQATT